MHLRLIASLFLWRFNLRTHSLWYDSRVETCFCLLILFHSRYQIISIVHPKTFWIFCSSIGTNSNLKINSLEIIENERNRIPPDNNGVNNGDEQDWFIYLGLLMTTDNRNNREIRRRISAEVIPATC